MRVRAYVYLFAVHYVAFVLIKKNLFSGKYIRRLYLAKIGFSFFLDRCLLLSQNVYVVSIHF